MSRIRRLGPRWLDLAAAASLIAVLLAIAGSTLAEDEKAEEDRTSPKEDLEQIRADIEGKKEHLRPERYCPESWRELVLDLEKLERRLESSSEADVGSSSKRRNGRDTSEEDPDRAGFDRDLDDLKQRMESTFSGCLRFVYQYNLQIIDQHRRSMREALSTAPSETLHDLEELIGEAAALKSSSDTPTDYHQVEELIRGREDIEHNLATLDACTEDLRRATSRIYSDSIEQTFEKLCRVAERCWYPPHIEGAREVLASRLAEAEAARDSGALSAVAGWSAMRLERCLPGARGRIVALVNKAEATRPQSKISEGPATVETASAESGSVAPLPARIPIFSDETCRDDGPFALTEAPHPSCAMPASRTDKPRPARASRSKSETVDGFLTMNVWQSAWGDFSDFESLTSYLRRNRIRAVNLNPGFEMFDDFHDEAYGRLKPLVESLRGAGVERIQFLYAELNYPVERYARFLRKYPDLGIDAIVDDSEFTDYFVERFRRNFAKVDALGLDYAAFVTLEGYGNSGVSDETRRWAIEHLDQPILMSYFSCSVDEQIEGLRPYLDFGDRLGRGRFVKVAILMGGKSVGRERSCEQALEAADFQRFVRRLDRELHHRYASYAGIVLETNRRHPRYDVAPETAP